MTVLCFDTEPFVILDFKRGNLSIQVNPHFRLSKIFFKDFYNIMGIIRNRKNSSASFQFCREPITRKKVQQFRAEKPMKSAVKKTAVNSIHDNERSEEHTSELQ